MRETGRRTEEQNKIKENKQNKTEEWCLWQTSEGI